MSQVQTNKTYKSPMGKLVKFFEQSRDQWKAKCLDAKALVKQLKNKVNYLETSRTHWKQKAKALKAELVEAKRKEQNLQIQLESMKKKATENESFDLALIKPFNVIPSRHTYSLGYIVLFLELVLKARVSLRGASRSIEIINSLFQLPEPAPSYSSGRMWLLRLGYYKLTRPKKFSKDWVWIIDHTVQIGAEKFLVILGLCLSNLPAPGHCLKHEDVEPITLLPVTKSNGQVVYEQLEATTQKTGVPREIIGDYASDLKLGIEEFCRKHPETDQIYDIKHKTATVLKHELKHDVQWNEFSQQTTQTKNQLQQTSLAFLAPRNQKTKARYMNIDTLVSWGQNTLAFIDKQEKDPSPNIDKNQLKEKLGWLTKFREHLEEWEEIFQVISLVETFVREQGLYYNCFLDLSFILPFNTGERTNRIIEQLLYFVDKESLKCQPGQRLLGSSEVLESSLGQQKQLEKEQAKSGFTGLILGIAALVSTTTTDIVKTALETVSTRDVFLWCQETLGKSVQAKRKDAFASR
jgi:hypothetical protein